MEIPQALKYQKSDEWVRIEGEEAVIGITDYAQNQLSDIVYVDIAVSVGDTVAKGDTLATVESVKAAADVNFPVSGEIIAINEDLAGSPEIINKQPYTNGWMVKIKLADAAEMDSLLDAQAYEKYCEER